MRGCAQTTNSMRRLKATFIDQVDAHAGVGGGANSVDLVRSGAGRAWLRAVSRVTRKSRFARTSSLQAELSAVST